MTTVQNYSSHPNALVESVTIGKNTRIWAFAHVLSGAVIGADCNICDHVFIENDVRIGDRVTIKSGVQLWDGITLDDDVFVGPNATFTNDSWPRSKRYPEEFKKTLIKRGASIGANATILPGLTIGTEAMIGAGAVVTRDVPPKAIVVGNPARIIGYIDTEEFESNALSVNESSQRSKVEGVALYKLQHVKDLRGDLTAIEWYDFLPFVPRRCFFVYNVPNNKVRGEHAHKKCHEFLICLKGTVSVVVDDGNNREEYQLSDNGVGLYFPPMTWTIQYKYSADAMLFVLASQEYDSGDYFRDYDEYISAKNK